MPTVLQPQPLPGPAPTTLGEQNGPNALNDSNGPNDPNDLCDDPPAEVAVSCLN